MIMQPMVLTASIFFFAAEKSAIAPSTGAVKRINVFAAPILKLHSRVPVPPLELSTDAAITPTK